MRAGLDFGPGASHVDHGNARAAPRRSSTTGLRAAGYKSVGRGTPGLGAAGYSGVQRDLRTVHSVTLGRQVAV